MLMKRVQFRRNLIYVNVLAYVSCLRCIMTRSVFVNINCKILFLNRGLLALFRGQRC